LVIFDFEPGTGTTVNMGVCRFGPYEVLARLASGGAASIFLARIPSPRDSQAFRLICLKTLLDRRAQDDDFVAMFLDEARIGCALRHPCCVHLEDYGEIDGIKYQVMEFIFGMNIWELLSSVPRLRSAIPRTTVAQIIADACRGLHYAHELKNPDGQPYDLIHRDISPQNIMITYDGKVKLLDFGVARAETGRNATATGIVKGKFAYMSPEQISGAVIDHRSDLYSMGIIMFECLASRRLYKADSPQDVAKLIIDNRPPPLSALLPDMDGVLDRVCAKALAYSANDRFETALQMAEALDEYIDDKKAKSDFVSLQETIDERFLQEHHRRQAVAESARRGAYDERELMDVFKARPVLELDFNRGPNAAETSDSGALRLPFSVADTSAAFDPADTLNLESGAIQMSEIDPLADPERMIATRIGDGLKPHLTPNAAHRVDTGLGVSVTLSENSEVPSSDRFVSAFLPSTAPSVTRVDTSADHVNRLTMDQTRPGLPPVQTYTFGVVLMALVLGCCLGMALGLYLARSFGLVG
jgi:serine/threonine protein kinase